MIHYTCDKCQKKIENQALRYVVRMEMQAEFEEADCDSVIDESQLEQMQEILAELDEDEGEELIEDVYQRHRFDLCNDCYHRFKADPLAIMNPQINFSRN